MSKIKICGVFMPEDIDAVNEALPDYTGFVFAPSRRQISAAQGHALRAWLDRRILAVGVFVDAVIADIAALCREGVIDMVQLHGNEDADYIERLKDKADVPVIKAVRVQNTAQIEEAQQFACDYLLLDTYAKNSMGGSGRSFDWSLIPPLYKPYFIAGGIDVANINKAVELKPYCIDISSGAETNGLKDYKKIAELVRKVRSVK